MSNAIQPSMNTKPAPIRLTIRQPDDWHVHVRDGEMLSAVAGYTARQCGRAIIMPNLPEPSYERVTAAEDYRARIVAAVDPKLDFTPLMTCYLTDTIDADEIERGHKSGVFTACNIIPGGGDDKFR